jgi:hypothetical protein
LRIYFLPQDIDHCGGEVSNLSLSRRGDTLNWDIVTGSVSQQAQTLEFPAREALPAFEETPKLPILDAREAGYICILFRAVCERKRKLEDLTFKGHAQLNAVSLGGGVAGFKQIEAVDCAVQNVRAVALAPDIMGGCACLFLDLRRISQRARFCVATNCARRFCA